MVMNKRFRTCSLDQPYLLPPSLQDWLPPHHLARFVAEVVDELDLSAIYAGYERKDGRGLAAYHPAMLTRVLLYGGFRGQATKLQLRNKGTDEFRGFVTASPILPAISLPFIAASQPSRPSRRPRGERL